MVLGRMCLSESHQHVLLAAAQQVVGSMAATVARMKAESATQAERVGPAARAVAKRVVIFEFLRQNHGVVEIPDDVPKELLTKSTVCVAVFTIFRMATPFPHSRDGPLIRE